PSISHLPYYSERCVALSHTPLWQVALTVADLQANPSRFYPCPSHRAEMVHPSGGFPLRQNRLVGCCLQRSRSVTSATNGQGIPQGNPRWGRPCGVALMKEFLSPRPCVTLGYVIEPFFIVQTMGVSIDDVGGLRPAVPRKPKMRHAGVYSPGKASSAAPVGFD